jgi:uncharacterized protein YbjT (DUF2867 family)
MTEQDQGAAAAQPALRVLVLGGAGFIGRHAVAALVDAGAEVIIGSRHPDRIDHRLPATAARCLRRMVRFEEHVDADDWRPALAGVDVVLNCVGILRQRGRASYERVHHLAPRALAEACRHHQRRLVHVSALGLDAPARSRFLTSKQCGEAAVRASGADWAIARPSLLDGQGGYGAWWLRAVARLPVYAVPADALGRVAALDVAELGEALTALCLRSADELGLAGSREFELGGPEAMALSDYIGRLRSGYSPRRALCLRVPGLFARAVAHVCDLLHATPFSFGHWELLRRDNVPAPNRMAELLGRAPRAVAGRPAASRQLDPGQPDRKA